MKNKIKELSKEVLDEVVSFRHFLNQNPEESFKEFKTVAFVKEKLKLFNVDFYEVTETGVVAIIKGDKQSDKVIALRADMDALFVQNKGFLHACGHDAHTASLLGVVKIINSLKQYFGGTIKFVFQPGEECLPGGAIGMIKEGVLQNPKPLFMLGQHVMPQLETGKLGFCSGKYMASSDELYITIKGKGGHGGMPNLTVDPVVISAHVIIALQQVVSRRADPKIPTVLTIGKVEALGVTNVIPNEVKMEGTFRTMNEEWRKIAHEKMVQIATGIAESMDAECEFKIIKGYPYLYNNEQVTERLRDLAVEFIGEENVVDLDLWMGAEDFAYYSQVVPSSFYRLGTGNKDKKTCYALHTAEFNIDDDSLETSIGFMSYAAIMQLDK